MSVTSAVLRDCEAPGVDDAREAIVDAYYLLADALVMMPRPDPERRPSPLLVARNLRQLTALEDRLRDAAEVFARQAGRNQYGDPDGMHRPGGSARHDWLARLNGALDALQHVRETGLTETHARTLYRLKKTLDEVTDI